MERKMLTISQAAKRIGVSVTTLRKWADSGLIATERLPESGYRRFDANVVELFLEEMKEAEPGKLAA